MRSLIIALLLQIPGFEDAKLGGVDLGTGRIVGEKEATLQFSALPEELKDYALKPSWGVEGTLDVNGPVAPGDELAEAALKYSLCTFEGFPCPVHFYWRPMFADSKPKENPALGTVQVIYEGAGRRIEVIAWGDFLSLFKYRIRKDGQWVPLDYDPLAHNALCYSALFRVEAHCPG